MKKEYHGILIIMAIHLAKDSLEEISEHSCNNRYPSRYTTSSARQQTGSNEI